LLILIYRNDFIAAILWKLILGSCHSRPYLSV